jgi:hypothetical protein
MPKRPIDEKREAAGSMDVGDESDRSPIREIIPLVDGMCVVKEQGLWLVQLADSVDPGRTNASIPNTQQKLVARGSSDPLVGRTLLQAKRLLKSSVLPKNFPALRGLSVTLEFLKELDALQGKATEYGTIVTATNNAFGKRQSSGGALHVPALGDVAVRGKNFIQGADHSVRLLWELARLFYPDLKLRGWCSDLKTRMIAEGAAAEHFAHALGRVGPGLGFLRNARNAVEHPKPGQAVVFNDYRLKPDGKVHAPSIEVVEKDTPLPETDLGEYFAQTTEFLVHVYETMLVHLCALHMQPVGGFEIALVELEPDKRRYPHVKYGYGSMIGGQLATYAD